MSRILGHSDSDSGPDHDHVTATFEGAPLSGRPGVSIAAALLASGRDAWRTSRDGTGRRGVFCGIGVCFDCIVEVDGESGQRACMIPLREGMQIREDRGAHEHAGSGDERTQVSE